MPWSLLVSTALHAGLLGAAAYVVTGGGGGGGGAGGDEPGSFTIRVRVHGEEPGPLAPETPEPVSAPAPTESATETAAQENDAPMSPEPGPPAEAAEAQNAAPTPEVAPEVSSGSGSGGGAGGGAGSGSGAHEGEGSDAPGLAAHFTPAVLRSGPRPEYPAASVLCSEEGSVLCALHVRADGRVEAVEIVRSSGHKRLDQAAVAALERWTFEPARSDGTATTARVLHQVAFRLE